MGLKRLGNRGRVPERKRMVHGGKLMVMQGGFGFLESAMVPSLHLPLRIREPERKRSVHG